MPYQYPDGTYEKTSAINVENIVTNRLLKQRLSKWRCSMIGEIISSIQSQKIYPLSHKGRKLRYIYAVDASDPELSTDRYEIKDTSRQYIISYIHAGLLSIDLDYKVRILTEARQEILEPEDSLRLHIAQLPTRHIAIGNLGAYDSIRYTVYWTISDDPEIMNTYKWLIYRKWQSTPPSNIAFKCPLCRAKGKTATFAYDSEKTTCGHCGREILITDRFIGFREVVGKQEMYSKLVGIYMNITEHLLMFNQIRLIWNNDREKLNESLFIKDGSLACEDNELKKEFWEFISFAYESGYNVNIVSQEKSQRFFEHLNLVGPHIPKDSIIMPDDEYIHLKVQGSERRERQRRYGFYHIWGAKIFVKIGEDQWLVLNIPTKYPKANPRYEDLIGADDIIHTIQTSLLNATQINAIEMVHDLVSIERSQEQTLRDFIEDNIATEGAK